MINYYRKKGTIGITMVMLVFGLLMAVAMSYHKTLQTETMVQNNSSYSDRAMDAAFSGVNYAMALIQAEKSVFLGTRVYLTNKDDDYDYSSQSIDMIVHKMDWISLSQGFDNYFDEDRKEANQSIPPYRFIVSCSFKTKPANTMTLGRFNYEDVTENGSTKKYIYIKSIGEYIKYEGPDDNSTESVEKKYKAQIIAKCLIDTSSKTIVLKKYKKVMLQVDDNGEPTEVFFYINDNEII